VTTAQVDGAARGTAAPAAALTTAWSRFYALTRPPATTEIERDKRVRHSTAISQIHNACQYPRLDLARVHPET